MDEMFFVESVLHPTDFSPESDEAFAHGLAIALVRQTEFTILHAGSELIGEDEWTKFPRIRETLEKWNLLSKDSPRSEIFEKLSVAVKKANIKGRALASILDYLDTHPTDLIVLATEGREGLARFIRGSTAEGIARGSETMTLFVPQGCRGFVSLESGDITLKRILVPVDFDPDPATALLYAARACSLAGGEVVDIQMLRVGKDLPSFPVPKSPGCTWTPIAREGGVVDTIIATAEEQNSDLIVMATAGHDGILDALRGSVTEQVLRRAPCPLLAIPRR
jgi:nucleotide-binding universal stress UspA family protein